MRKARILVAVLTTLCVAITSCAPSIYYLGDTYVPSSGIEVFYDAKDVQRAYKVIGKMTNDKILEYDVEEVKVKMIEKAKQVGGDGIIFTDIGIEKTVADEDRLAVKANLIKYL